MNDARTRKQQLRRALRQRRRDVGARAAQAAAEYCAHILSQQRVWQRSAHIALYLASDGEIDPAPIAARARRWGRLLYLPRVRDAALEFAHWRPGERLDRNRYGIDEPRGPARPLASLDLLLVPLVAWSRDGTRLGMGAGFYDRALAGLTTERRPVLVGLGYAMQECETLPRDPWDVPMDAVLTETGLCFSAAPGNGAALTDSGIDDAGLER